MAGRVFTMDAEGKPKPVTLRLGITDGTYTEILEGELKDGQEVIVAATTGSAPPRPGAPGSTGPRVRF